MLEVTNLERTPGIDIKNISPHVSLKGVRLLSDFYGPDAVGILRESIRDGKYPKDTDSLDQYFLNRIKDIYDLPDSVNPQEFFNERLEVANSAVRYVADTLSPYGMVDLNSRVSTIHPSPFDRLSLLGSRQRSDGTIRHAGQRQQFETIRQLQLAHTAAMIKARSLRGTPVNKRLAEIQQVLDDELYTGGEIGDTDDFESFAFHANETNRFLKFQPSPDKKPTSHAHIKRHTSSFRLTDRYGYVLTNFREKEEKVATIKAWRKAIGNGGVIHPLEAVKDNAVIMLVAMGGDKGVPEGTITFLHDSVKEILEANFDSFEGLTEDNYTNGYLDQSAGVKFTRSQANFSDLPVPVELMVYEYEDFINSRFHVGNFDQSRRTFDGQAHRIYEHNRLLDIVPLFYPVSIYDQSRILDRAADNIRHISDSLLQALRVE